MKRIILNLSLITLILCGCSQRDLVDTIPHHNNVVSRNAQSIYRYIDQTHPVKSRKSNVYLCPIIQKGDTVAFLANYENGWELFSNNTELPMILMKSETGSFYPGTDLNESLFEIFYKEFVNNLPAQTNKDSELTGLWQIYNSTSDVNTVYPSSRFVGDAMERSEWEYTPRGGRLQTKWSQDGYYNQYTPFFTDRKDVHSDLGCGAVAVGQMLYHSNKYFGTPATTVNKATYNSKTNTYSFSGKDSNIWKLMDSGEDSSFCTDPEKMKPTAVFLGYIATLIKSEFGLKYGQGTPAYAKDCANELSKQMNIVLNGEFFNSDGVQATLKNGYPVCSHFYYREGNDKLYGHGFLIDWLKHTHEVWFKVYSSSPKKDEEIDDQEHPEDYGLSLDYYREHYDNISFEIFDSFDEYWVKMNWGWGGLCDDISINADDSVWKILSYTFNDNYIYTIR